MQTLLDRLAEDDEATLAQLKQHNEAGDEIAAALMSQRLQGLRIALGRILECRDGLPAEGAVTAFNRGRDFIDSIT